MGAATYGLPAIPARHVAGDFLTWERSLPEFPSSAGWALRYALSTPTVQIPLIHGSSSVIIQDAGGGAWTVSAPAGTTAAWAAGSYQYQEYVQKAGGAERRTLASSRVEILPNLAAGAADLRSTDRKMLEALEALAVGKATKDQLSYSIAGRSITRLNPDELIRWTDYYRARVAREEAAERASLGLGGQPVALGRFV